VIVRHCTLLFPCPSGGDLHIVFMWIIYEQEFRVLQVDALKSATHSISLYRIVCIALSRIALNCIVSYCIALYCIVLHCIALYCIALNCIVLYCVMLSYLLIQILLYSVVSSFIIFYLFDHIILPILPYIILLYLILFDTRFQHVIQASFYFK
jgi:hypothetical protein